MNSNLQTHSSLNLFLKNTVVTSKLDEKQAYKKFKLKENTLKSHLLVLIRVSLQG